MTVWPPSLNPRPLTLDPKIYTLKDVIVNISHHQAMHLSGMYAFLTMFDVVLPA